MNSNEARALAHELHAKGVSNSSIADELFSRGYASKRTGQRLHESAVRYLLKTEVVANPKSKKKTGGDSGSAQTVIIHQPKENAVTDQNKPIDDRRTSPKEEVAAAPTAPPVMVLFVRPDQLRQIMGDMLK